MIFDSQAKEFKEGQAPMKQIRIKIEEQLTVSFNLAKYDMINI